MTLRNFHEYPPVNVLTALGKSLNLQCREPSKAVQEVQLAALYHDMSGNETQTSDSDQDYEYANLEIATGSENVSAETDGEEELQAAPLVRKRKRRIGKKLPKKAMIRSIGKLNKSAKRTKRDLRHCSAITRNQLHTTRAESDVLSAREMKSHILQLKQTRKDATCAIVLLTVKPKPTEQPQKSRSSRAREQQGRVPAAQH